MAQTSYTTYTESDNLTPDTTTTPTTFAGPLHKLVGILGNRIKAITGKSTVFATPDISIADLNTKAGNAQTSADSKSQIGMIEPGAQIWNNIFVGGNIIKSTDLRSTPGIGIPNNAVGVFITARVSAQSNITYAGLSSADSTPDFTNRIPNDLNNETVITMPLKLGTTAGNEGRIATKALISGRPINQLSLWVSGWWR